MTTYQGRALRAEVRRSGGGRLRRVLLMMGALALLAVAAQLPWRTLRSRVAVVRGIEVRGTHYLDAAAVTRIAGLAEGQDLFALDLTRARQRLLMHPRIARAEVTRRLPRGLSVRVEERVPVLLVRHGVPWEMDSCGVLLQPLASGVTADVPLLDGLEAGTLPAGAQLGGPRVERALAWVAALDGRELRLAGQVSELDVRDPRATSLLLMDGTRVLAPAWPPEPRPLSALRVVLADLHQRGVAAREVDVRFDNQVIVRPAAIADDPTAGASRRNQAG
jgi:cell division protein FtsQ